MPSMRPATPYAARGAIRVGPYVAFVYERGAQVDPPQIASQPSAFGWCGDFYPTPCGRVGTERLGKIIGIDICNVDAEQVNVLMEVERIDVELNAVSVGDFSLFERAIDVDLDARR